MTMPPLPILVVEDDPGARLITAAILEGSDYMVVTAADGEQALALLSQQPFAVVVTDIRMRVVDGIAVLQAARRKEYQPAVILLTGYGDLQTAIDAVRSGAFEYLQKPCAPDTLRDSVARAIQQRTWDLQKTQALHTIMEIAAQVQGQEQQLTSSGQTQGNPPGQHERYTRVGVLSIDNFRHQALLHNQLLHLTRTEFALLRCLAEAHGRVLTYSQIVQHTHEQAMGNDEALSLLKQHIRNVRRKIPPEYLVNVRSIGYMLVDPAEEDEHPPEQDEE